MQKVSIVTPLYNSSNYIKKTILSIINQTYRNWELLIVDDFSNDGSLDIITEIMKSDSRIKLFRNSENLGAAISRNIAIKNATGKYIAFLDSDDEWFPKKLEKQIQFMEKNDYLFSYTKYIERNNDKVFILSGPKVVTQRKLKKACWMGCLTVMYNREEIGLIQIPNLKKRNDYALWLKVIKKANCYLLPETLASYNKRFNTISDISSLEKMKYAFLVYNKILKQNHFVSFLLTIQAGFWSLFKKIFYKKIKK